MAAISWASTAAGADEVPAGTPPQEGRIYNVDSQPFRFRLARTSGATWSEEFMLAPGAIYTIRPGKSGDAAALEGITGDGKGHVTIEYAHLGGRIRLQLPAKDINGNLIPNWFHVKDSNGFSRMLQARTKEEAEQKHKELLAEPPLTEGEIAQIKRTLRANFVLFDK